MQNQVFRERYLPLGAESVVGAAVDDGPVRLLAALRGSVVAGVAKEILRN